MAQVPAIPTGSPLDYLPAVGVGLDALSNMLFGGAKRRKREDLINMLKGELGKPAISDQDINSLIPNIQRSMVPSVNQASQRASNRLGLDSGAAQGEIARSLTGPLQGALADLKVKFFGQNADKRTQILQLLTQLV